MYNERIDVTVVGIYTLCVRLVAAVQIIGNIRIVLQHPLRGINPGQVCLHIGISLLQNLLTALHKLAAYRVIDLTIIIVAKRNYRNKNQKDIPCYHFAYNAHGLVCPSGARLLLL